MSAAALEPARWSRRRWLGIIAGVFLAEVLVMWHYGERPRPRLRRDQPTTTIHFAGDPEWTRKITDLPDISDPTLLALASPWGFSGAAWFNFTPLQHEFSDWTEAPRWLGANTGQLGEAFSTYVANTRRLPLLIANVPYARFRFDREVPPELAASNSTLHIEGEIAHRPLVTIPELRTWSNSEILSNTVIQVVVNGDGDTVSTVLLMPSGSAEVDQWARQTAIRTRFAPLANAPGNPPPELNLSSGQMIFLWVTLPSGEPSRTSR